MRHSITLICLLAVGAAGHAAPVWTKFVAPDKSYSFHYPTGWKAGVGDLGIQVDEATTGEQLLALSSKTERDETARAVTLRIIETLQRVEPSLKLSQWDELGDKGEFALARIAYDEADRPFTGNALVVLSDESALWFSYAAAEADYSRLRAKALLDGFIHSFADGPGSKRPEVAIPELETGRLDRNARAFIFVVEFGCGTAFTEAQEQALRGEVVAAWTKTPAAQRAQYDQYPALMKVILALKQEDLATVQGQIRQSLQEILAESQTSPAIATIRQQMDQSNRALVAGTPPLSAAAADGYAELWAFAEALGKDSTAGPEAISRSVVESTRATLLKGWPAFTDEDKQAVLGAPALWMAVRMTFRQGTAEEKQQVRASLKKLVEAQTSALPAATGPGGKPTASGGSATELGRRYLAHQTLMMMQQQTFNTYMWSRGFPGWTPMGKMW